MALIYICLNANDDEHGFIGIYLLLWSSSIVFISSLGYFFSISSLVVAPQYYWFALKFFFPDYHRLALSHQQDLISHIASSEKPLITLHHLTLFVCLHNIFMPVRIILFMYLFTFFLSICTKCKYHKKRVFVWSVVNQDN